MTDDVISEIKALLGPGGWVAQDESAPFCSDIMGQGGDSLIVARPESTGAGFSACETLRGA